MQLFFCYTLQKTNTHLDNKILHKKIKLYTYSSEYAVISPMSFSHTQHIPELYKLSE